MNTDENNAPAARRMESIRFKDLLINFTTDFTRSSATSGVIAQPRAFWRPAPDADLLPEFFPLGDVVVGADEDINGKRVAAVVCESVAPGGDAPQKKALALPGDYERLWTDPGPESAGTLWRPIPPEGYVAMGLVCSSDNEKPPFHAVRCIRADLVIASSADETLWNNWDSGVQPPFVAWSIKPALAPPGEIYFAPGTFVGYNHNTPASTYIGAYSLRMEIPLKINSGPELPMLTGFKAPIPAEELPEATQIVTLPWFAVDDNALRPIDQLGKSPYYYFSRTDHFVLIGSGHNTSSKSKLFRWTASRALVSKILKLFTSITSIEVKNEWPAGAEANGPIRFSAQLSKLFTRTETSTSDWTTPKSTEVVSFVPKNKMLAVYQLQSHYQLRRQDGSEVAINFAYADNDSLHFAEYPTEEAEAIVPTLPVIDSPPVTDSAP